MREFRSPPRSSRPRPSPRRPGTFKQVAAMNLEYMGSRTRMEGTPVENYDNFVREAMKANKLLKVYETVHEADPDVELIRSFSPATNLSEVWMTPQWMKWLGLFEVRGFVEWMLSNECHPRIYT